MWIIPFSKKKELEKPGTNENISLGPDLRTRPIETTIYSFLFYPFLFYSVLFCSNTILILIVQLYSLKEYLRKGITENPIRI